MWIKHTTQGCMFFKIQPAHSLPRKAVRGPARRKGKVYVSVLLIARPCVDYL